jgi:hypothetical protein
MVSSKRDPNHSAKKVSVKCQMLYSVIFPLNLWASYKIKKLRKFLLLFITLFVGTNFMTGLFYGWPGNFLISLFIYSPVLIYYLRKWSTLWNANNTSKSHDTDWWWAAS